MFPDSSREDGGLPAASLRPDRRAVRRRQQRNQRGGGMAWSEQVRHLFFPLFLLYCFLVAVFLFAVLGGRAWGLSSSYLVRDPAATYGFHPLTGALSHLAVFGWASGGVISLFSATVLRRAAGSSRLVRLLTAAGTLSIALMLDDLFLFHEELAPSWLAIPEAGVYLLMASAVLTVVFVFRADIFVRAPWLLALAGVWFAASIALDTFSSFPPIFEDALKSLGIYTWSLYWAFVAAVAMVGSGTSASRGRSL